MALNKRTVDFPHLLKKVEAIRLKKEEYVYHSYLGASGGEICAICDLPLHPYSTYVNGKARICTICFNNYISADDYMDHLNAYEIKVLHTNKLVDMLSVSLKNDQNHIELDLVSSLFQGLSLLEIEQLIGNPKSFGSFDHGVEAGCWKLGHVVVELWFKNQIFTDVVRI
ncbi:hypothetical protein PBAL39_17294 [Pedobacter sp. BAL39]|uniref:hypothetical protein n=1 Tax=Pedobacter sp. BAL39 TaxID=391596 RepID=UPI000155A5AE|nr:hypothetical protein [Pedobacter sp. BAL39]EDM34212.1 hypothetical protein PBAL39_17294 [Pedobacter sp. BAL39]